jgi:hypothetical protein
MNFGRPYAPVYLCDINVHLRIVNKLSTYTGRGEFGRTRWRQATSETPPKTILSG